MDAPLDRSPTQSSTPAGRVSTWVVLVVILALGLVLRLWVIARAEVAARDSIGFIRYAVRFEHETLTDILRTSEHPPGYPLAVLLVSSRPAFAPLNF